MFPNNAKILSHKAHRKELHSTRASDIKGEEIKVRSPSSSEWRLALAIDTRVLDFRLFFEEVVSRPVRCERIIPEAVEKLPFEIFGPTRYVEREISLRDSCKRATAATEPRTFPVRKISRSLYIIHENVWPGLYLATDKILFVSTDERAHRTKSFNPTSARAYPRYVQSSVIRQCTVSVYDPGRSILLSRISIGKQDASAIRSYIGTKMTQITCQIIK